MARLPRLGLKSRIITPWRSYRQGNLCGWKVIFGHSSYVLFWLISPDITLCTDNLSAGNDAVEQFWLRFSSTRKL